MAATTSERNLNPYVEDCDSDQSEHPVLSSFRRSSPGANVAAKRSSPSDLGTDKPLADTEKMVPIDLQSEASGYSSHTAGTMSSADSASSAKMSQTSTAPSSAASMPPSSPATSKRRPAPVEDRRRPSESPRKPLQCSSSTASKRPPGTRRPTNPIPQQHDCGDPKCKSCGPNAPPPRRGRRDSIALDSGRDVPYPPFDARSQRSDPSTTYTSPPSPTYNRQPAPYLQGSTMMQPAQSRPRAASTTRRPISYHGNPPPSDYWPSASGYPSPPQEYGPPPSMSAHYAAMPHQQHPQMSSYMMAGTPPSSQFYQGNHPMAQQTAHHMSQATPPYEQQRPSLSARNSSGYQGRMPGSGFGQTLVTYGNTPEPQALPSARYGNAPQSAKQERFPPPKQLTQTPHQGSESSEEYESSDEDEIPVPPQPKQIMPPPALKSKPQKEVRPALRHARTTQVTQVHNNDRRDRRPSMSQSQTLPERPREKDTRTSRGSTAPHSRSMSISRPKMAPRVVKSAYEVPRGTVVVESNRPNRSQHYQTYEPALRRTSYIQQYENYDDDEESSGSESDDDVETAQEAARRQLVERRAQEDRRAQEEQRRRQEDRRVQEEQRRRQEELQAEEDRRRRRRSTVYQDDYDAIVPERAPRRRADSTVNRIEAPYGNTINAVEAYQQQIRGSDIPLTEKVHKVAKQQASRVPSDPDRKTRISQSARTTLTNGTSNGDIRLRVDASAPLSLSFNGDMEGRTLQINPAEDGLADIIISGNRGEENVYRSEKGSSVRSKRNSLIANSARREAEEVSVNSGRSSQGRRQREVREVREVESRRDVERRPLRRHTQKYNY